MNALDQLARVPSVGRRKCSSETERIRQQPPLVRRPKNEETNRPITRKFMGGPSRALCTVMNEI